MAGAVRAIDARDIAARGALFEQAPERPCTHHPDARIRKGRATLTPPLLRAPPPVRLPVRVSNARVRETQ